LPAVPAISTVLFPGLFHQHPAQKTGQLDVINLHTLTSPLLKSFMLRISVYYQRLKVVRAN